MNQDYMFAPLYSPSKYKEGDTFLWHGEFGIGTKDQQKFGYICKVTKVYKSQIYYIVLDSTNKKEIGTKSHMLTDSIAHLEESELIVNAELASLVYL